VEWFWVTTRMPTEMSRKWGKGQSASDLIGN